MSEMTPMDSSRDNRNFAQRYNKKDQIIINIIQKH